MKKNTLPLGCPQGAIYKTLISDSWLLFWLLFLAINILVWLPVFWSVFPTIGLGHDSQIYAPTINGALREGNTLSHLMPKILSAREDIYSYPYFGVLYPFYLTLGLDGDFSYLTNLKLDFASVVFHLVVACLSFSLLIKRMGVSSVVAILFGVFYGYSLHLKMWSSWIWALSGYTWIPFCLLGLWEIVNLKNRLLGFIYLLIGFGFIALGTALPLVYAVVLSAFFFLFCFLKARPNFSESVKIFAVTIAGGFVSLLIGASHLLPTLSESPNYIRWYSGGYTTGSLKPPYEGTLDSVLSFDLHGLSQFIAPTEWFGIGHLYLGVSVIALFIYGVALNWRKIHLYPLLFGALYFLFDAFGDATFVHRISYQLPLLNSIRYPLANTYVTTTIILIVAALACSELLRHQADRSKSIGVLVISVATLVGTCYQLSVANDFRHSSSGLPVWVFGLPALASILAILLCRSRYSSMMLVILLIAYLPQNSMIMHPKVPKERDLYLSCAVFVDLQEDLYAARARLGSHARLAIDPRVNSKTRESACLSKQVFLHPHLQSVAMSAGWDVMRMYHTPRPYYEHTLFKRLTISAAFKNHTRLLNAGVSHVLRATKLDEGSEYLDFYTYSGHVGELHLYEIADYHLGFANLGCISRQEDGRVMFVSKGGARDIFPPNAAKKLTPGLLCDHADLVDKSISLVSRYGSTEIYQIEQSSAGLFVSDQVFSEHWVGYLNGVKVEPLLVDGYRLAFNIPAGTYTLKYTFMPSIFRLGVWLTGLGVLVLLISVLFFLCGLFGSGRAQSDKSASV
ncbi:hypothetical protein [Arenicella xantha]|uniref:Membrane protein YfhO n=1 Tax=Arenicella xantha TaxID=644221 RepID=A0A395JL47_9GAMM|nr:hypothetical protein [Arenicella xantha]RBP51492.1 hypothetical protein DFR28_102922 [Arenicella xantha]